MILPIRHRKGFTIVEVVISAIIFVIATTGIVTMVSSVSRPQEVASEDSLGASLFAQYILSQLRAKVDPTTWDSGNLAEGNYVETFDIYTAYYEITNDVSGGRLISLNVVWNAI